MSRILSMWRAPDGGLWFLPTVLVFCGAGAALLLVESQVALQNTTLLPGAFVGVFAGCLFVLRTKARTPARQLRAEPGRPSPWTM